MLRFETVGALEAVASRQDTIEAEPASSPHICLKREAENHQIASEVTMRAFWLLVANLLPCVPCLQLHCLIRCQTFASWVQGASQQSPCGLDVHSPCDWLIAFWQEHQQSHAWLSACIALP